MATSTIKGCKKFSVSISVESGAKTGATHIGIPSSSVTGIILRKNDDVFYQPIIYSLLDSGYLEAQIISGNASANRTYNFYILYI